MARGKETTQVSGEELNIEVDATTEQQHVTVAGIRIRLARPYVLDFEWVGNRKVLNQLRACWHCDHEDEKPMNPRLVGKPGVGKTALGYAAGVMMNRPVYFFQGTADTLPNDLLINPLIVETSKDSSHVEYIASTVITAMIVGGVCILDEGNRMQEKAWASLAPLLDSRRYIESIAIGLLLKAHPAFRFVATMNDDKSCFDLPDFIRISASTFRTDRKSGRFLKSISHIRTRSCSTTSRTFLPSPGKRGRITRRVMEFILRITLASS